MIKTLILSGYGLNCEEETAYAFKLAGAEADIVHINDLINREKSLKTYQILAFPGGFSYGDDTGSGNAYANRIKNNLQEKILSFFKKDKLAIGICNGFQIMANLGILPAMKSFSTRQVALTHNDGARYLVRWVDLKIKNKSPWLRDIKTISLPIAHGEGKFYTPKKVLEKLRQKKHIALLYTKGEMCKHFNLKANPNGSLQNIAGISDRTGKILGLMPHPERAIFFHHLPNWTWLKEKYKRQRIKMPKYGQGLKIFKNAISYFS